MPVGSPFVRCAVATALATLLFTPAEARRRHRPRPRIERVLGTISRVSIAPREIGVVEEGGQERSIEIPARLDIRRGKRRIPLQEVHPGDMAAVTYQILQGHAIARDLRVRAGPRPGAPRRSAGSGP